MRNIGNIKARMNCLLPVGLVLCAIILSSCGGSNIPANQIEAATKSEGSQIQRNPTLLPLGLIPFDAEFPSDTETSFVPSKQSVFFRKKGTQRYWLSIAEPFPKKFESLRAFMQTLCEADERWQEWGTATGATFSLDRSYVVSEVVQAHDIKDACVLTAEAHHSSLPPFTLLVWQDHYYLAQPDDQDPLAVTLLRAALSSMYPLGMK